MPRTARQVVENIPHHITQRGNNKQDIFFDDNDRRVYLKTLEKQSEKYGLTIMGYCLMCNHIHLIAIPHKADSLSTAVGRTHFIYTQYINRLHNRSGHLWQGRFYSCALDEYHFLAAMRYIECNPVHAKICRLPWKYAWSSAAAHAGKDKHCSFIDLKRWFQAMSYEEWERLLLKKIEQMEIKKIKYSTCTGRPLGSDSFISKLERKLGCRLRAMPVGRPKNKKDRQK